MKVFLSLTLVSFIFALGSGNLSKENTYDFKETNQVEIIYDDELKAPTFDGKKGYIVLKNINDEDVINKINSVKNNVYLQNLFNFVPAEVNVPMVEQGVFYYQVNDKKYAKGSIKGTSYTTSESLNNLSEKISNDILQGKFTENTLYDAATLDKPIIEVGESWNQVNKFVEYSTLDYEGLHYGDYSESISYFSAVTSKYSYNMVMHVSYLIPNTADTDDFRTSSINYSSNVNGYSAWIYDFGPLYRTDDKNISYSFVLNGIGENRDDYNTYVEYETINESPSISSKTVPATGKMDLTFEYLDPRDENTEFYEYAKGASYQSCSYIYEYQTGTANNLKINNQRKVSMVRDDLFPWNDKTVNFDFSTTIE